MGDTEKLTCTVCKRKMPKKYFPIKGAARYRGSVCKSCIAELPQGDSSGYASFRMDAQRTGLYCAAVNQYGYEACE